MGRKVLYFANAVSVLETKILPMNVLSNVLLWICSECHSSSLSSHRKGNKNEKDCLGHLTDDNFYLTQCNPFLAFN